MGANTNGKLGMIALCHAARASRLVILSLQSRLLTVVHGAPTRSLVCATRSHAPLLPPLPHPPLPRPPLTPHPCALSSRETSSPLKLPARTFTWTPVPSALTPSGVTSPTTFAWPVSSTEPRLEFTRSPTT